MSANWRDDALCLRFPDLPWIADPQDRSVSAERAMEGVCGACGVFDACEVFAVAQHVTSGFYAGQDRTPARRSTDEGRTRDGAA